MNIKYRIHIRSNREIIEWIKENAMGGCVQWHDDIDIICFEKEEDAVAFKLKWL